MKVALSVLFFLFLFGSRAFAQTHDNVLQLGVQGSLGTGDFRKDVSPGYGGSLKYMRSLGDPENYITLEAGYDNFRLKVAPKDVNPQIHTIPVLIGYRRSLFKQFRVEPQAGISFNKAIASYRGQFASASFTGFSWSAGASYAIAGLNDTEIGLRYQNTIPLNDGLKMGYVSIKLAYNFDL